MKGPTKTRSSRRAIALGQPAVQLLHTLRGKQLALQAELQDMYQDPGGYVLADQLGNPIDSNRLSREFARVVKAVGLPTATLHSFRHAHASLLLAEGVSIKGIADRLGHSNPAVTLNIYSHLLPGLQDNAARLLDKRLGFLEKRTGE